MPLIKLELQALESRENPSLPQLGMYGGVLPPQVPPPPGYTPPTSPVKPVAPTPEPASVGFWEETAFEISLGVWGATHTVYKRPLMWPLLPIVPNVPK